MWHCDSGRLRTAKGRARRLARNVELKLRCDAETLSAIERRLADDGYDLVELHQIDTYFRVARGRLKVREIHAVDGNTVELIAYVRPDELGTRLSAYERVAVPRSEAVGLLSTLRSTLDELVVVEKRRTVAIAGRTRVHLDRVAGLGCFVELETVLDEGDDDAGGRAELAAYAISFGLQDLERMSSSYGDLVGDRVVDGTYEVPSRLASPTGECS